MAAQLRPRKRGSARPLPPATVVAAHGLSGSGRPGTDTPTWPEYGPPLRGAKTRTNHARPASRSPAQPGACARHGMGLRRFSKVAEDKPSRKWLLPYG